MRARRLGFQSIKIGLDKSNQLLGSMAAISKIAASAVSATNEVNLGLANFNIDFSLVKIEAPVEYRGLRNALSRRRVENAEQGPVHRTARRLGA